MNAVCALSIVPVRKEPSDTSEMTTQLFYGEPVINVDAKNQWKHIQSKIDDYSGWVDDKQLKLVDQIAEPCYLIKQPLVLLPSNISGLPKVLIGGSYLSREEYTKHGAELEKVALPMPVPISPNLIQTANQFLSAPYLWGGKSMLGIDCSGLTQVVARINGILLERDSAEQAKQGIPVNFEDLEDGDLVFLNKGKGDKVTHVGFSFIQDGQRQIIHASGAVRHDRLEKHGIFNENGDLTHHYLFSKRIT